MTVHSTENQQISWGLQYKTIKKTKEATLFRPPLLLNELLGNHLTNTLAVKVSLAVITVTI